MTYKGHENEEFRIRSSFGGNEKWILSGSEKGKAEGDGEVVVWDTVSGTVMERVRVHSVEEESGKKRFVDREGNEKKRRNVISCVAWKNNGRGDQWCCAGTNGVVTVFGAKS